jgi:Putative alpha-1,2-mannosidase
LQVGVSAVSVGNARFNREHDLIWQDFDAVRKKADKEWQSLLSGIRINCGSPEERVNFYTALYHSSVVPNRINDCPLGNTEDTICGIGRTGKGNKRYSNIYPMGILPWAWHPDDDPFWILINVGQYRPVLLWDFTKYRRIAFWP